MIRCLKILAPLKRKLPGLWLLYVAVGVHCFGPMGTNLFRGVYLEPGKTVADYRNVALNPLDSTNREPVSFPHATSNSEYNQREFAARCAIDGNRRNDDVHGCGSGDRKSNRTSGGGSISDGRWKLTGWCCFSAPPGRRRTRRTIPTGRSDRRVLRRLEEKLELKQVATGQEFPLAKRTVTWLVLQKPQARRDRWCALCEFEAWGRDAAGFAYVADAAFAAQTSSGSAGGQGDGRHDGISTRLVGTGRRRAGLARSRGTGCRHRAGPRLARLCQSKRRRRGAKTVPPPIRSCWVIVSGGRPARPATRAREGRGQHAAIRARRRAARRGRHAVSSGRLAEMWSDESFTTPPFLAAAGQYDAAIAQLLGVHRRLGTRTKN